MRGTLLNIRTGESFELEDESSIGRSRDSVVVIADPRVSRKHALIRLQDDGFWFFDLGSINGSYLNGRRLTTASVLKPGDEIRIGEHQFRYDGVGPAGRSLETTTADLTIVDVQSKQAILLVSDIQGYTELSEKLGPDHLAPLIGSWYASTESILHAHRGTIDKFIGDCVLAYWLETDNSTRLLALRAAEAMQEACNEVQQEHAATLEKAGLSFRAGAAIHIGATVYGAFSPNEFTLLGDAVNLTFRLEQLTRQENSRILLSRDLLDGWDEGAALCRSLGIRSVKGRSQEVELFTPTNNPA